SEGRSSPNARCSAERSWSLAGLRGSTTDPTIVWEGTRILKHTSGGSLGSPRATPAGPDGRIREDRARGRSDGRTAPRDLTDEPGRRHGAQAQAGRGAVGRSSGPWLAARGATLARPEHRPRGP